MSTWTSTKTIPTSLAPPRSRETATLLDALRAAAGALDGEDLSDENRLRRILTQPRTSLARTHATALVAGLMRGMTSEPEFYLCGDPDNSFDESWILRLVERACQHDHDSVRFLLTRRVAGPARASVSLLLSALVSQLALDGGARAPREGV